MELTMQQIIEIVCKYYNLDQVHVLSKQRLMPLIRAKHMIIYFARKYTRLSLYAIGEFFEGRKGEFLDHASVIHAVKSVTNQIYTSKRYAYEVSCIEYLLQEVVEPSEVFQQNDYL